MMPETGSDDAESLSLVSLNILQNIFLIRLVVVMISSTTTKEIIGDGVFLFVCCNGLKVRLRNEYIEFFKNSTSQPYVIRCEEQEYSSVIAKFMIMKESFKLYESS
jgi:hypothetical protein